MFANVNLLIVLVAALYSQVLAQDSSSTIVSWISSIGLDDITTMSFDSADKNVLISTTAATFGFPVSSVSYLAQSTAVEKNPGVAGVYKVVANMSVSVLLGDTSYTSVAALYGYATGNLTNNVNTGDFENLLKQNAEAAPAPHLTTASAYSTAYTTYTTTQKIDKDENLDLTQGGVAIIVICCLVMFFVVLYMAWGATHAKEADHGKPNSPKGYAISEDEV